MLEPSWTGAIIFQKYLDEAQTSSERLGVGPEKVRIWTGRPKIFKLRTGARPPGWTKAIKILSNRSAPVVRGSLTAGL